jgi:hypothetical protein
VALPLCGVYCNRSMTGEPFVMVDQFGKSESADP